ncbi:DUF2339 domain-containing protein [Allobranchiibius sp. CTAmp26]|uniref:DUF2339 domain-containing protein n=1 Tax=Allobranchiibius sp. CTAmp26 TaxID=2815214 RepID=UPI001AA0BCD7|nr:DUF2339 domain-containing protein [Allobranchiibius sp. CTAmp26]MBO1753875.1 hypothetical protein [Allobranchiibius sp. CTAmp26]
MTTPQFPSPSRDAYPTPPAGHHPPAAFHAATAGPTQQRAPFPLNTGGGIWAQSYVGEPSSGEPYAGPQQPYAAGPQQPYAAAPEQPGGGYPPPPPYVPRPPRTPWWQRDGVISRLLAGLGVLITLIGVVMMLVLAAQAGYFGPAARVGAGSALSAVLIGAGVWLFGRTGGRTGAVALATTGFAGIFMVVVTMTDYYRWLAPVAGLALAGAVAAAAVALSTYWRSQPMTVLAFLAIAGLAPFITRDVNLELVGFLLLLQAAGILPEKLRGWVTVAPVRTIPVVLALLGAEIFPVGDHVTLRIGAAATCAALGLVAALLPRGKGAEPVGALVYAVASLPLLVAIPAIERPWSILAAAVLAAVTVVALVVARPVGAFTLSAAAVVASIAGLEVCVTTTRGHLLPALIAVVALGLLAVAHQQRSLPVWTIGTFFAILAVGVQVDLVQPAVAWDAAYAARTTGTTDALAGLVVLAAVLGTLWSARRVTSGAAQVPLLLIAPVPAFWSLLVAVLTFGAGVGGKDGYHAAQLIVSAALMAGAMAALALGLKSATHTAGLTVAGLGLVAAALAKLFLYDLAALDGLVRAGSFMAVGLLLLAAGTRYAQAVARRTPDEPTGQEHLRPIG